MENYNFQKIGIGMLILFLLTGISYTQNPANSSATNQERLFPQNKVDRAVSNHWLKKNKDENPAYRLLDNSESACGVNVKMISGQIGISTEECFIPANIENTLYIGPAADTMFINSDYEHNGDVITLGQGVLLVDNAKFTLYGHLNQFGDSKVILKNGAYWYAPQLYNAQYMHQLQDNASFESTNSTVDGKCVYQIRHYDKSQYIARQTHFTNWNFHKIWNESKLILEDANMVGDLTINDSCEVVFTRCDTILPWLGARDGDVFEYKFPPWDVVSHYVFDNNLDGINGINYSVTFDSCRAVMWGLESWEGSSIKIDSSFISIAFRLNKDVSIENIYDYTFYWNLTFPFNDRVCQITRSHLHMWFPYVYDNAVVYIDDCHCAETKAHNQAEIYMTNTISDGFPSCTSPVDSGFISVSDAVCRTFSSSWHRATLLLINTRFEPRQNFDASQNIAHGYANFLAVNCTFPPENEPWAVEAALVMFAAIDSSGFEKGDSTEVTGSAWIDAGPYNSITFDRYKLYWLPTGDSVWTLIEESTGQIRRDTIGTWNTAELSVGEYDLRLTVWDSAGDSLTAFKTITLQSGTGINEEHILPGSFALLQNYPNPFNPQTTISYQLPLNADVTLKIYNLLGQEVKTLVNENKNAGNHSIVWDGKNNDGLSINSGIYFYCLKLDNNISITKKLALIK